VVEIKHFLDLNGLQTFYNLFKAEIYAKIEESQPEITYGYDEDGYYASFEKIDDQEG
jgi:hypothetical protein